MMNTDYMTTPLGVIEIQASPQGIRKVMFTDSGKRKTHATEITQLCKQQLTEYFAGKRKVFNLPLDLQGTAFQKTIWTRLIEIPFGVVASYREVATSLHKPKAARAVGTANGRNPISIIVPCHRVIASNGALAGYAGGMERKAWLLAHEKPNPY